MSEVRLRGLLPHTWHAFFARFGRVRAIQAATAEPICGGRDVLVMAPTASGKTEAVVAPIIERILAGGGRAQAELSAIVIAPTRALTNDLARRLRGPVNACGLSIDTKTGDSPDFDADAPPNLLLTTPESLDSLLCRHPSALKHVRALVMDDVHLVDGTARGDQLRCLASRLHHLSTVPLQRCAASATIAAADELARRYLGSQATAIRESESDAGAQRTICAEAAPAADLEAASAAIIDLFLEAPARKILAFANRRNDAEALVATLAQAERLRGRVFAHHGSLSRAERLRVERRFLDARAAVCVATTTLEIGVDIGDVDRVALLGPPPNVSSLLQRVGRGNRREGTTHILCLYGGEFERLRFEHLLRCAESGRLFNEEVGFRPSTLAQQALSLSFQNRHGWVSAGALHARLPPDLREEWSVGDCEATLHQLAEHGFLRVTGKQRYVAEERAKASFERGQLHSNIKDSPETEVIDETTGRSLGTVRFTAADRKQVEQGAPVSLGLGGKKREIARLANRQIVVRSRPGTEASRFIARQAPRYSYGLARDLAEFVGVEPGTMVLTPSMDGGGRGPRPLSRHRLGLAADLAAGAAASQEDPAR